MPILIKLTCPKCGGKLEILSELDWVSCGYCGNELILQRSGGVITVAPIINGLKEVKIGADRAASELAIVRLNGEISDLIRRRNNIDTSQTPVGSTCSSIIIVLIGLLSMLAFTIIFAPEVPLGLKIVLPVLCVIFFIIAVRYHNKKLDEASVAVIREASLAQSLAESIDQEIIGKKRELKKHQDTVQNR